MPETPPDKLMGWLTREEEEFGLTGAVGKTIDFEACRKMLQDELGYEPSEEQVGLLYSAARYKYGELPLVEARAVMEMHSWGKQFVYRDVSTGRYISSEEMGRRLFEAGLR